MSDSPRADRPLDATLPDLRVARVERARSHPNADRLLILDIDLGDELRQIVAGIALHYELAALEGLHIVVVRNLLPARLRGEISQGMLLAAKDGGELGLLLAPDAAPGTAIRTVSGSTVAETIDIGEFGRHVLEAGEAGVTLNGEPLEGARLVVDRGLSGRLR